MPPAGRRDDRRPYPPVPDGPHPTAAWRVSHHDAAMIFANELIKYSLAQRHPNEWNRSFIAFDFDIVEAVKMLQDFIISGRFDNIGSCLFWK